MQEKILGDLKHSRRRNDHIMFQQRRLNLQGMRRSILHEELIGKSMIFQQTADLFYEYRKSCIIQLGNAVRTEPVHKCDTKSLRCQPIRPHETAAAPHAGDQSLCRETTQCTIRCLQGNRVLFCNLRCRRKPDSGNHLVPDNLLFDGCRDIALRVFS